MATHIMKTKLSSATINATIKSACRTDIAMTGELSHRI